MIVALAVSLAVGTVAAEEPLLTLRASVAGSSQAMTIELLRWSSDAERAPLVAAWSAPPPAPPVPAGPGAGRGGRGGRGSAPPPSPAARLTAAIKAAPTVGFIWGGGPTGYAIRYAWRAALPEGRERIVLVTDRRLGAHVVPSSPAPGADNDAEFTVIDMQIDGRGVGAARTSLASTVIVDAGAGTLALESDRAPGQLEVSR